MERDGGDLIDLANLADELRQLMALRSRSSVRDRACPELDRLLTPADRTSRDVRYVAIAQLIDDAAAAIHDPSHRSAATALLGSGDRRWTTVSQRGAEAAAVFGCGWDAYRRRRTNGTSQLDDTIQALAESMVAIAFAGTPTGAANGAGPARSTDPANATETTATVDGVTDPDGARGPRQTTGVLEGERQHDTSSPPSTVVVIGAEPDHAATSTVVDPNPRGPAGSTEVRSRRPLLIGVAAAVAIVGLVGGLGYLATRRGPTTRDPNPVCSVLDHQVGDLPAGSTEEMIAWAARFSAFARNQLPDAVACAGPMEWRDGLVVQTLAGGDEIGIGAIVAADEPGSPIVYLNHREHWSYRRFIDQYGVEMIGPPVGRGDRGSTRLVNLARGSIVGEAPGVSFLVTGPFWQEWTRRGGLDSDTGVPVSISRDLGLERVQDFENGRFHLDLVDPGEVRWEPIVNPAAALPDDLRNSVVRAEDGTAWYVSNDLVRHWIPTANDYRCGTGLTTSEHRDVSAQAIATLGAGEPFRCR